MNAEEDPETAQMALLIYVGHEVEDIHDSLPEPTKPTSIAAKNWTIYEQSLAKLNLYFVPQKSNDFALFELMNIKPETNEATKNYAARLRQAAGKCDFTNWSADKMIKCLVITNMRDEDLKLECLQKEHTLNDVLDKAQKKEDAQEMSKKIDSDEVNQMGQSRNRGRETKRETHSDRFSDDAARRAPTSSGDAARRPPTGSGDAARRPPTVARQTWDGKSRQVKPAKTARQNVDICRNCGNGKHDNFREECPALGRICRHCRKPDHFAKVCYGKMIQMVQENRIRDSDDTDVSDDEVDKIEERRDEVNAVRNKKIPLVNVQTSGYNVVWQPDTAASRDIWSPRHVDEYERKTGKPVELRPTNIKLWAYGGTKPLELKGQFEARLKAGESYVDTNIIVTQDDSVHPLISEQTARKLGVVSYDPRFMVNEVKEDEKKVPEPQLEAQLKEVRPEVKEIIGKYPEVFS